MSVAGDHGGDSTGLTGIDLPLAAECLQFLVQPVTPTAPTSCSRLTTLCRLKLLKYPVQKCKALPVRADTSKSLHFSQPACLLCKVFGGRQELLHLQSCTRTLEYEIRLVDVACCAAMTEAQGPTVPPQDFLPQFVHSATRSGYIDVRRS